MIQEKIDAETNLIKELETNFPKMDVQVGLYHPNNTKWHIHDTKIRDAYWRRRMLIAQKEDLSSPHEIY